MKILGFNRVELLLPAEEIDAAVAKFNDTFGFCKRGEAKDFVRDGHIELGGSLPVDPNGGLIGEAYIHGMNNVAEGVRQVRGTSVNQVPKVEHVLVSSGTAGAVLGRA